MYEYYMGLHKYWASQAKSFYAAGYRHMSALFQRYADEHLTKANSYVN